jgi:hypothetical protein
MIRLKRGGGGRGGDAWWGEEIKEARKTKKRLRK